MQCDVCGSEKNLVRAIIEGTELVACSCCARFGKILGPVVVETKEKKKPVKREVPEEEVLEVIVPDFQKIIRRKRESMGLKQEDFAKKINEKLSVVHKIETGEFKPTIDMARKLERILGVRLVEEYKEEYKKGENSKLEEVTIGDIIKIKKR